VASRPCAYVNTSIVLRALNPKEPGHGEARRFLEECCRKCRCVYSSVHELERMTPMQRLVFEGYLEGLGAAKVDVDTRQVLAQAEGYRLRAGAAESRRVDIMHMVAARTIGCTCILAIDRFIRARSRDFKLAYANHYTGCEPCCPQRSGGRTGTVQAYSSASSSKLATQTRPGRSTGSGQTQKSPSKKRRRGSGSSRRRPGPRRPRRRGG